MKYYFAPMEGITLYPLRNIHKSMFGEGVDKYFTPFLTAQKTFHFKNREKNDVLPEHITSFDDYGNEIVPQIMAGKAETFLWAAGQMRDLGYHEVNFNLGCPAATVVNRKKGAGMLADPDYLRELLTELFDKKEDSYRVSVKTRLGMYDDREADELMRVYASFPISELTIHARVREDFYKGKTRPEAFARAVDIYREAGGTADICYNGDIDSPDSEENLFNILSGYGLEAKEISGIMIGRGLLQNPALVRWLHGGKPLDKEELREYLGKLYREYEKYIPEDRNVIFKMLEHWAFLQFSFADCDKSLKAIRKSRSKGEYMAAVNSFLAENDLK